MYLRNCLRLYSINLNTVRKQLCDYNLYTSPPATFVKSNSRLLHITNIMSKERIATYDEVVALTEKPSVLLIDVREPSELQQLGKIPTSINIPLASVSDVLQNMPKEEFLAKFGRPKPEPETEIIFHCKLGGRSAQAMDKAIQLGYKNARNYKGSFEEWSSKNK